jgi:hypothetical protein
MILRSLFTSSSDPGTEPFTVRVVVTALWTCVWLALIDLFINTVFAYPQDPKNVAPGGLRLYFDYGRSVEGKLRRETRNDPNATAPITLTGWYSPLKINRPPAESGKEIVTIYGMSHAMRLAQALDRTSQRFVTRSVGAPGAAPNWSYGAYLRDRGGGESKAAVLAFLSANLASITTMSSMTWGIDLPNPYTSDRFVVTDKGLGVVHPPYASFADYVAVFDDADKWAKAKAAFAQYDTMYNSYLTTDTLFDKSALFRLIRRAYGQRYFREKRRESLDQSGFNADSEQVKVAQAIVRDFAAHVREDGMVPVIFIANNLGYSDFLFQALEPALKADNIPYLSSDKFISPADPRAYLPDSHFTDENDDKLARELEKIILANERSPSR